MATTCIPEDFASTSQGFGYMVLEVWEESYDVENNQSVINWRIGCSSRSGISWNMAWYLQDGDYIKINGELLPGISEMHTDTTPGIPTRLSGGGIVVNHDDDGKKTLEIEVHSAGSAGGDYDQGCTWRYGNYQLFIRKGTYYLELTELPSGGNIYVLVNGEWKRGKPYDANNSEWKKGKAYAASGGLWKKTRN